MKKYQVIARRFRPQVFAEVVGQQAIVTTLKNALKFEKLGAAYLFCGTRGTGKTTLARLFAKALNCQNLTTEYEPCNLCPSCLEIASGHSLNFLEIDGASNRGIDDIRQINETVGYAPSSGKYKIYLIDEVHMLTKEAFNALLKTLEEPPSHVKFFFATTEAHKIPQTIISRCQRFDLHPIPAALIKEKLHTIALTLDAKVDEAALALIADHAEGALRDAESLLDQLLCYCDGTLTADHVATALGLVPKSLFFQLDQAIYENSLSFAFELAEKVSLLGNEISHFLEGFMEHIRTILHILLNGSPNGSFANSQYRQSATLYTQEQCLYILDYLIHWHQEVSRTPFKRVGLEIILLHLLRTRYRLTPDALVKRLMELEGKELIPERIPEPTSKPPLMPSFVAKEEPPPISVAPEFVKDSPLPFEKKLKEIPSKAVSSQSEIPKLDEQKTAHPRYETLLRFAAVELEGTLKKG